MLMNAPSPNPAKQPETPALAWIFGQPVTDLPQDLFIPPDALKVVLSSFEGPLDLLLYLIRRQNIDVLDIPMLRITEQYLGYIAQMEAHQFDLAAEYLLMAAVLIEIKSRLLLPQTPDEADDEESDPRAELVRRLLAYEQMKLAAQNLDALPRAGRDFAWVWLPLEIAAEAKLPEVAVADLQQAWLAILSRAQNHKSHAVVQEAVSVRSRMSSSMICAWMETSSIVVGSSSSRIRGSVRSARAIAARWSSPPESSCGCRVRTRSESSTAASPAAMRSRTVRPSVHSMG